MPQRNVNLTDHLDDFIAAGIESGRFSNASEIVREGLRLLEQREREDEARIAWLRSAADDAFASLDRHEGTRFASRDELRAFLADLSGISELSELSELSDAGDEACREAAVPQR